MTFRRVGVLADDLTGAGDVALAFEAVGWTTEIWTPAGGDLPSVPGPEVRVWILDTESRGFPPKRAARVVRRGVRALCHWKADFFFKKIDSTLRGPVGAELAAFLESVSPSGPVPIVPAFPRMGRTTVKGRHFINGVPLHRTPFGQDPVHPIRTNVLNKILDASSRSGSQRQNVKTRGCVRVVPDVENDREMVAVARKALLGRAAVGSAGFAAAIARQMGSERRPKSSAARAMGPSAGSIGVVMGSAHPLSGEQWGRLKNFLPKAGVFLIERPLRRGSPVRVLGRLVNEVRVLEKAHRVRRWVVTGGETAFGLARLWKQPRWRVVGSVEPGVALCRSVERFGRWMVLKPGGFGSLNVLVKAVCQFRKKAGRRDTC